eukprot:g26726.t1
MTAEGPVDGPTVDMSLTGRIDAVCDAFEDAFRGQREPQIEDYLTGWEGEGRSRLLHELLAIELEIRRSGETPATLDEFEARFPNDTELVAAAFADSPTVTSAGNGDTPVVMVRQQTAQDSVMRPGQPFGDYEIIEELGRGGMGVVYKARQVSAGRDVAIKVIRSDRLAGLPDEEREQILARFQTEARAAAGIEHDHLVTVFDVGEIEGTSYYSMRFIEGQSLSERVRQGPLENRVAAAYLEPVCRAVHVAHEQGILHRDLKPHNVMVDARTGRALVADFGLAKLRDAESTETQAGEIFGSPPYMSPEQAESSADVQAASDVYSLGATLYHLLTGRPPFQAANIMQTLKQVQEQEPVSPRQLNPEVDRDLETICLKCLEKSPDRRYPSAAALADDLAHFLAGRPISARPLGRIGRTWRWCRRNKLGTTVIALLIVIAVGGTLFSYRQAELRREADASALAYREQKDRADSEARRVTGLLKDVKAERDNAREEVAEHRHTLENYLATIQNSELLKEPRFVKLKQLFVKGVLAHYERFVAKQADNPKMLPELAEAFLVISTLSSETPGQFHQALPATRRAMKILQQLVAENPAEEKYQRDLLACHISVGMYHTRSNQAEEGLKAFRQAEDLCRRLVAKSPGSTVYRHHLADVRHSLGLLFFETGKTSDAFNAVQEALAIRKKLFADDPADVSALEGVGSLEDILSLHYDRLGRKQEAFASFRNALAIRRKLVEAFPKSAKYRSVLAMACGNMGHYYKGVDRLNDAFPLYRESLQIRKQLVDENPTVPQYQNHLGASYHAIGNAYRAAGENGKAIAAHQQALKLRRKLAESDPGVSEYQSDLAVSLNELSSLYNRSGRNDESLRARQESLRILIRLSKGGPAFRRHRVDLAKSNHNLGTFYKDNNKPAEARAALQSAIKLWQGLHADEPDVVEFRSYLAGTHNTLADLHLQEGRTAEAVDEHRRGLEIYKRLRDEFPTSVTYRVEIGHVQNSLGIHCLTIGKPNEALASHRESIRTWRQLIKEFPKIAKYRALLARSCTNLGVHYEKTRQPQQALTLHREALEIRKRLVRETPKDMKMRNDFAFSYSNLADIYDKQNQIAPAIDAYRNALSVRLELVKALPNDDDQLKHSGRIQNRLGILYSLADNDVQSRAHYAAAIRTRRTLVERDPESLDFRIELAGSYVNLALLDRAAQPLKTIEHIGEAIPLLEKVLDKQPDHRVAGSYLRNACFARAEANDQLGRYRAAVADWEKALHLDNGQLRFTIARSMCLSQARSGEYEKAMELAKAISRRAKTTKTLYRVACALAVCSQAAANDKQRPPAERRQRASAHIALAMELLERIAAKGDLKHASVRHALARDPALDGLRGESAFRQYCKQHGLPAPAPDDRVAAICDDQRRKWIAGDRVPIESYLLDDDPIWRNHEALADLVHNEYRLRCEFGLPVDKDRFIQRFPTIRAQLERQFEFIDGLSRTFHDANMPQQTVSSEFVRKLADGESLEGEQIHVYEVGALLGEGGFGVVYCGRHVTLRHTVALKLTRPQQLGNDTRRRMMGEARTAANLRHDHIVPLYDIIEDDDVLALVYEYCPGQTLAEWMADEATTSPNTAVKTLLPIIDAVHHAHKHGVYHRDIKPPNILLDTRNTTDGLPFRPKLTDFGLAHFVPVPGDAESWSLHLVGSPRYMPPEQALGERPNSPAGDIYSLGAILYELLTGEPTFDGTVSEILRRIQTETPTPPGERNPAVPKALSAICLKCLARDPADRFATAELLAEELRQWLCDSPGADDVAKPMKQKLLPRLAGRRGSATCVFLAGILFACAFGVLAAQSAPEKLRASTPVDPKPTEVSKLIRIGKVDVTDQIAGGLCYAGDARWFAGGIRGFFRVDSFADPQFIKYDDTDQWVYGITYGRESRTLWVMHPQDIKIVARDPETGKRRKTLPWKSQFSIADIAWSSRLQQFFVCRASNGIVQIDAMGRMVGVINTPFPCSGVARDDERDLLFLMREDNADLPINRDDEIYQINLKTGKRERLLESDHVEGYGYGIEWHPPSRTLYVNNNGGGGGAFLLFAEKPRLSRLKSIDDSKLGNPFVTDWKLSRTGNSAITRDTETQLDWLDLRFTTGKTITEINRELKVGGRFAGFRYATLNEVKTLYRHAGIASFDGKLAGPEWDKLVLLQKLLGLTGLVTSENWKTRAITADALHNSSNPFLSFFMPILFFVNWSSVEIPICRSCKLRFRMERWLRGLLFIAAIFAAVWLIMPLLQDFGLVRRVQKIVGAVLVLVAGHGRIKAEPRANGGKGSLEWLVKNPATADRFKHLVDKKGRFVERGDVQIRYLGRQGNLKPGFGAREGLIGPELGFGHVVGDAFDEPVLLIKLAWGGKSLAADFRPPSSGGKVGPYYRLLLKLTRETLRDAPKLFPQYAGRTFELVGLAWHQGWNDRVNQKFNDQYEKNLANFIRDIRKDLGVPKLPFVIAETGMSGHQEKHPRAVSLMKAQAAVAKHDEFQGNVAFVGTKDFFRPRNVSPSGQAYHWNSNAETYTLIGEAMGKAVVALIRKPAKSSGGAFSIYAPSRTTGKLLIVKATPGKHGLSLKLSQKVELGFPVATVVAHPEKPLLYVAEARGEEGKAHGAVVTLDRAGDYVRHAAVTLKHGCSYLSLDRGNRFLLGANYFGGFVDVYALDKAGRPAKQVAALNEGRRNAHCVLTTSDNRFIYIPYVKETNAIYQYRFDPESGTLTELAQKNAKPPAGTGPRHIAYHPKKPIIYFSNEQHLGVSAYDIKKSGELKLRQVCDAVGKNRPEGRISSSDIVITPDGRYIFAGLRGHSCDFDHVSRYRVKPNGDLELLGLTPADKIPWGFAFSPDGRYLLVTAFEGATLTAYAIGDDGGLTKAASLCRRRYNRMLTMFALIVALAANASAADSPEIAELKERFGEQKFHPKGGFIVRQGQPLPELVWEHPRRVAKVVDKPAIPTRWFNEQLNEVKVARRPGRYFAYGEAPVPSGPPLRRAMACCCLGKEVDLKIVARRWLAVTQPDAAKRAQPDIDAVLKRWRTSEQGAVELTAFLENGLQRGPARIEQWQMENATRQVRLKRKLMGLADKPLQKPTPRRIDGPPAAVLRRGTLEQAGVSKAQIQRIERELDAWYKDAGEPMSVVIARKGVIVLTRSYGALDGRKVTIDTPMRLDSAMKPLIGVQLATYVDRGFLKLDEPIGRYLPDFNSPRDRMLTFRAGHVHATGVHFPWSLAFERLFYFHTWHESLIAHCKREWAPGSRYRYGVVGVILSVRALELLRGRNYWDAMERDLFAPLGIVNILPGGRGFSAESLARIGVLLDNHGRYGKWEFFSEKTYQAIVPTPLKPYLPKLNRTYGIGLQNHSHLFGRGSYGHGGGCGTLLTIHPEKHLVFAMVLEDRTLLSNISIGDATAVETDTGQTAFTFVVTRDANTTAETVTYTTNNGTATVADGDFNAAAGTLTFPMGGALTMNITVIVNGDTKVEANETFTVDIINSSGGAVITDQQGLGTINNDDTANLTIANVAGAENHTGTSFLVFQVTLSAAVQGGVNVNYATANGTAVSGSDYTAASGTISFTGNAGESVSVPVIIQGDTMLEANETFTMTLSGIAAQGAGVASGNITAAGSPATGTINNDDSASISIGDVSAVETHSGSTLFAFPVTLNSATGSAFTVNYATANSTAIAGSDYFTAAGVLNFSGTAGEVQTVAVLVIGDATIESNETFLVNLSGATFGVTISDSQAVGTIVNDDQPIPGVPTLTGPTTTTSDTTPTITWSAVASAVTYDLLVYNIATGQAVVNQTGITTNQFTPGTPIQQATHQVFVRSVNNTGASAYSSPLSFGVALDAPAFPAATAATLDSTPTISWSAVPGAATYEILVYNIDIGAQIIHQNGITGTQFTPSSAFASVDHQAFVRAYDTFGMPGAFSSPQVLEIGSGTPTITAPVALANDPTPTIEWTTVAGAATYELMVYNLSTGKAVVEESNIVGTQFTPTTDLLRTEHQAFVRAVDVNGAPGGYSSAYHFSIVLPATTLTGPASNTHDTTPTITWNSLTDADTYELLVYNTLTGQLVVNQTDIVTTFFTTGALAQGTHQVFVRGVDSDGNAGVWSAGLDFNIVLGTPVLTSPLQSSSDTTPTFAWTSVSGAATYDLIVYNVTTGQLDGALTGLGVTQITQPSPVNFGQYQAFVRAVDSFGVAGPWSAGRNFEITANESSVGEQGDESLEAGEAPAVEPLMDDTLQFVTAEVPAVDATLKSTPVAEQPVQQVTSESNVEIPLAEIDAALAAWPENGLWDAEIAGETPSVLHDPLQTEPEVETSDAGMAIAGGVIAMGTRQLLHRDKKKNRRRNR